MAILDGHDSVQLVTGRWRRKCKKYTSALSYHPNGMLIQDDCSCGTAQRKVLRLFHEYECSLGAVLAVVASGDTIYAACQDGHVQSAGYGDENAC